MMQALHTIDCLSMI